jgi:S-adenosylmethionine-diacylglycerol 3-amino-3-carboxypropyl transferase
MQPGMPIPETKTPRAESEISVGARLRSAVGYGRSLAPGNLLNALFASLFKGLVYPQIWEDPEVDMQALAIAPDSHVVAIASGGCNVLSYLTADPKHVTAIDLNPTHVALNRLKLAAAKHLPSWHAFYRFFGIANEKANLDAYDRWIAPHLDDAARGYWERRAFGIGRRRIGVFARNFYRYGLLGRCIGVGHLVARAYGVNPRDILRSRSIEDQRNYFATALAPLFERGLVRWALARQFSLFGLGIPPAQYEALAAAGDGNMASVIYERLERLSCAFRLEDNYFAWQAFGRGYSRDADGPLPPYLQRGHFESVRGRAARVEVLNLSFTEYLEDCEAASRDRYVLLDAQDWMSDAQLNALWREITRTAKPGARVIFRTAAKPSLLPGRVAPDVLSRWDYREAESLAFTARDRSAIYGGFHLYVLKC